MPIKTDFAFKHARTPQIYGAGIDLLGDLRGLINDGKVRTWVGRGFNLIWRPRPVPIRHFLQLMFTAEELSFTDITGSGIANRAAKNSNDILLGAVAYLQTIRNTFDGSDQHFEPGVWCCVPTTDSPAQPQTVVRMGSIPHGTTINLQGIATKLTTLDMTSRIVKSSITPFLNGSSDDGESGLVRFPQEEEIGATGGFRTDLAEVPGLTQEQLSNPNIFLVQANYGLTFDEIVEIQISSNSSNAGAVPDAGGGTSNIAFLKGNGSSNQNADAPTVTSTLWLQKATDALGNKIEQLQYTQRVILEFNTVSWPHISIGTLRPV
ncbi:MAG: hypothetical protein IPJ08_20790 [Burkholderiales bacterium]|nr:hypothetical protein [Burkholderiales bacterium]